MKDVMDSFSTRIASIYLKFGRKPKSELLEILHRKYESWNYKRVCRRYFLYSYIKYAHIRLTDDDMKLLGYFDEEHEDNMVTLSRASEFMRHYDKVDIKLRDFDLSVSGYFMSVIYHPYPYLLKSILDRVRCDIVQEPMLYNPYCVLHYENFSIVKHIPELLSNRDALRKDLTLELDTLNVFYKYSTVLSRDTYTEIKSRDKHSHSIVVSYWEDLLGCMRITERDLFSYTFVLPDGSVDYYQVYTYLQKIDNNLQVSVNPQISNVKRYCEISSYRGYRIRVAETVLTSSKTYSDTKNSYCLAAGDTVLTFHIYNNRIYDEHVSEEDARNIVNEILTYSLCEDFNIPSIRSHYTLSNFQRLKITDPTLFGRDYCRFVPPRCQPICVPEEYVQDELDKGKIVIKLRGNYYTSKDAHMSGGYNYIGFINVDSKDSDGLPIIRTYLKNHLLSPNYKALKNWAINVDVVELEDGGKCGKIDKERVLLPKSLSFLYDVILYNPKFVPSEVHTKKTTLNRFEKVVSGELPDYVRTILRDNKARRVVVNKENGNGLLECCNIVDRESFRVYVLSNREKYRDLDGKLATDIEKDIITGYVDHRIYGKCIEDYSGYGIIVFTKDGIIPYRYSDIESDNVVLLYLLPNGIYDKVMMHRNDLPIYKLVQELKQIHNEKVNVPDIIESTMRRRVDYTRVYISLVCYLARIMENAGITVKYHLIEEDECASICEKIYARNICVEGNFKLLDEVEIDEEYGHYISRHKYTLFFPSAKLISNYILEGMAYVVDGEEDTVYILSPVDLEGYTLWNYTLEQCLYYSIDCYMRDDKTEIVRIVNKIL